MGLNTYNGHAIPQDEKTALEIFIRSEKVGDKDCYRMQWGKNTFMWVEKETGIIIKEENIEGTVNVTYEINTVTEADVQKPDLTGYTEM